jgi:HD superfamily phosphohydrolase
MKSKESQFETEKFRKINLVADPIHGYIHLTWPSATLDNKLECTEKDLIDTTWLQRLRRIHQLQAVWWVFPGGEHTRFQHSLGAMHLGGLFACHLYDSLKENPGVDKSKPYVEETMRLAGLLHDVGHGPFCHFFDEEYLERNEWEDERGNIINHEVLGQKIMREKLKDIILKISRSPSGNFEKKDGRIDIDYLCFLIKKDEKPTGKIPDWLRVLKGLMTGVYTIDNLDYVWRDAYMCGILPKPIDVERIKHYSLTTRQGLALYLRAVSTLEAFLRFRFDMYLGVYYHRTVRAIELHMREIFGKTIDLLYGKINPYEDLDAFLAMDDWTLLCGVKEWLNKGDKKRKILAQEWQAILERKPKWRCLCERSKDYDKFDDILQITPVENLEDRVKEQLTLNSVNLEFRIDLPQEDPRRLDPFFDIKDPSKVKIYDPATHDIDPAEADRLAKRLPAKSVIFRLYVPRKQLHKYDEMLINAFDFVIQKSEKRRGSSTST